MQKLLSRRLGIPLQILRSARNATRRGEGSAAPSGKSQARERGEGFYVFCRGGKIYMCWDVVQIFLNLEGKLSFQKEEEGDVHCGDAM